MVSSPADLGMKPQAPKSSARRITAGSSTADTTTTGIAGYCPRSVIQRGKEALHPRHAQIEQDQVRPRVLLHRQVQRIGRIRLHDLHSPASSCATAVRKALRNNG